MHGQFRKIALILTFIIVSFGLGCLAGLWFGAGARSRDPGSDQDIAELQNRVADIATRNRELEILAGGIGSRNRELERIIERLQVSHVGAGESVDVIGSGIEGAADGIDEAIRRLELLVKPE